MRRFAHIALQYVQIHLYCNTYFITIIKINKLHFVHSCCSIAHLNNCMYVQCYIIQCSSRHLYDFVVVIKKLFHLQAFHICVYILNLINSKQSLVSVYSFCILYCSMGVYSISMWYCASFFLNKFLKIFIYHLNILYLVFKLKFN